MFLEGLFLSNNNRNMVWRPQAGVSSTGPQSRHSHEVVDSSYCSSSMGGWNKHLFVETQMTPQASTGTTVHRMPSELPPLHSSARPKRVSNGGGKLATMTKEESEPIKHVVNISSQQAQEQQQRQRHFFTLPRQILTSGIPTRIGVGGGDSVCGDSLITTNTIRSVDSRNDDAPSVKRSVFRTERDADADHHDVTGGDTFSEKVLGEMRRVQAAMRGGNSVVSGSSSIASTIKSREEKKPTVNHNGRHELLRQELVNEYPRREAKGRKNERLDYLEQRLINEQNERYESEISDLKQQLRSMEHAADSEIAELKQQLRTLGQAADTEITDLKQRLRAMKREADSEISELKEQLRTTRQVAESDITDLKHYIRVTDDEYTTKSALMVETYARKMEGMERKYKDAFAGSVAENDLLREEIHSLQEEAENKLRLMESECENFKNRSDIAEQNAELNQRAVRDVESKYEGLMMEKERLERMERKRMAMLDEMTVALEVAIAEKEDAVLLYNDLRDETRNYSNLVNDNIQFGRENMELKNELESIVSENEVMKSRLAIQFGRENMELKNELDSIVRENEVMKSRLALMDQMTETLEVTLAEKEDATLRCSSLLGEQKVLKTATESVANALECALAEKNEVIDRCISLERANTDLRNASDSASQLTDMMTQQVMDKYLDEIDELKKSNKEISKQRDDLKEELICVLETASSLQR